MNTAADMAGKIEIRKDTESGMFEVYNVRTGEVYTRERSDHEARMWRARRFTTPRLVTYCGHCLAEDLFVIHCKRHADVSNGAAYQEPSISDEDIRDGRKLSQDFL